MRERDREKEKDIIDAMSERGGIRTQRGVYTRRER